jgi:hypothetical protein
MTLKIKNLNQSLGETLYSMPGENFKPSSKSYNFGKHVSITLTYLFFR